MIHGWASNYNNLIKHVSQTCGSEFKCRYTPQSFSIHIDKMEKYDIINEDLKIKKPEIPHVQHRKHLQPGDYEGLPRINCAQIAEDLQRQGVTPCEVTELKQNGPAAEEFPIYLARFSHETGKLSVKKVSVLCYWRIR